MTDVLARCAEPCLSTWGASSTLAPPGDCRRPAEMGFTSGLLPDLDNDPLTSGQRDGLTEYVRRRSFVLAILGSSRSSTCRSRA